MPNIRRLLTPFDKLTDFYCRACWAKQNLFWNSWNWCKFYSKISSKILDFFTQTELWCDCQNKRKDFTEIYKIQKQLEKLAEAIHRNLYWESLSFINQYENENLSEGKIIEWSEVAKLMELPRLLKENTFTENCRIGFRKSYRVKIWNTRELFFEFKTPLPNMLNLFEAIASAKSEDAMEMLADELMVQKLKIASEILE